MSAPTPENPKSSQDEELAAKPTGSLQALLRLGTRHIRRLLIFIVGSTVLLIGIIMLVTPGPAVVVIPIGLGILGMEFAWARRLLQRFKDGAKNMSGGVKGWFRRRNKGEVTISSLIIYPCKSLRGISLDSVLLEARGLQDDRRWMVVDSNGEFITQRQQPRMAL
ncbi:MAG: PGPGW domain-containing protein, partial [Gammaproteobacteria bacterium]|nr:PGPGW domain-containing protein [Gammaproteobacteria bacterium]